VDVVGEPVGAMHSTQHTDLRRPRQTAGHMARGRAITAPRDGSCRLARHPERADPSASFALPTGSATGFSALRYGRMLRSPFTLYRASVGDSLIALSLVAAKHAGRKTDLGLDAAQNPWRDTLLRKSQAGELERKPSFPYRVGLVWFSSIINSAAKKKKPRQLATGL